MLTLSIGKKFLNGRKEIVKIVGIVPPESNDRHLGHEFYDENGVGYTENGMFNKNNPTHLFNLVGELPGNYTAPRSQVVHEQPGFFAHLANKMRENPFKTMFGLTLAGATGVATYNYATTGNIDGEDAAAVVEATGNFMRSLG